MAPPPHASALQMQEALQRDRIHPVSTCGADRMNTGRSAQIARALALNSPRRLHRIELTFEIQLEHYRRMLAGSACDLGLHSEAKLS